ncbi:30S ribosomal protein S15 [Aggregatibacter actinomycetemcomitans serotype e str. SC1083]|uniref:30S ribosomal protein S15 n=2 Tax=Aggregatibacter actinomycetemcomitans TaxID=714 RepID=G4A6X8_AGGAC|nr:30S ribosomal protein S15 [Aggregatibacter actinomycetemcomitans serotype e str. SC1083]
MRLILAALFVYRDSIMSGSVKFSFAQYVRQLLAEHKGERVYYFTYGNKNYWLKQPEQLKGVWHLLKPHPQQAFQNELRSLQYLAQRQAPVPKLAAFGEDYLVLEDGGKSVANWVDDNIPTQTKQQILLDCAKALAQLHQQGLVHGRPAIRDILWHDGRVLFIDFEVDATKRNLPRQKVRDLILFIYNLCREENISDETIRMVMRGYQQDCEPQEWQDMMSSVCHYRFLYYLLLPFKYIAKKDLIGVYRLFRNVEKVKRGEA